jgi:amidohydrolase
METAFIADAGTGGGPAVAFVCEYDALRGLGHACGHNLIGTSAVAALAGLSAVAKDLPGAVVVMGSPAEEGGGGKVLLLERGALASVDAALGVHPRGGKSFVATEPGSGGSLARAVLLFEFHGKAAHAAVNPFDGINALDALVQLYTGIAVLRQQLRSDARIHGIISHGGDAPNVVPHHAAAKFYVRAADRDYLEVLEEKVRKIAEGAAMMTETRVEIKRGGPTCYDMRPSYVLGRRYEENMRAVGMDVNARDQTTRGPYSTDFGNVSYLMPAVTGSFAIAHEPIPGHSQQVVDCSASDFGHEQLLKVSTAMALTALDLFLDPEFMAQAKDEHEHWVERYEGR